MLEAEYQELNNFTLQASKAIAQYHDTLEDMTEKDKKYMIEKILAKLDVVLVFTMQIRHRLLQDYSTLPATMKLHVNQALSELKTTMETAKTLSFNFTAVYYSVRDAIKGDLS